MTDLSRLPRQCLVRGKVALMKRSTTCLPLLDCFPFFTNILRFNWNFDLWAMLGVESPCTLQSRPELSVKVCLRYQVFLCLSTFSCRPFGSSCLISELRVILSNVYDQKCFKDLFIIINSHSSNKCVLQVFWLRRPTVMINWTPQCKIQLLLWLSQTHKFFHAWEMYHKIKKPRKA